MLSALSLQEIGYRYRKHNVHLSLPQSQPHTLTNLTSPAKRWILNTVQAYKFFPHAFAFSLSFKNAIEWTFTVDVSSFIFSRDQNSVTKATTNSKRSKIAIFLSLSCKWLIRKNILHKFQIPFIILWELCMCAWGGGGERVTVKFTHAWQNSQMIHLSVQIYVFQELLELLYRFWMWLSFPWGFSNRFSLFRSLFCHCRLCDEDFVPPFSVIKDFEWFFGLRLWGTFEL